MKSEKRTILRIDASARHQSSTSRQLGDLYLFKLNKKFPNQQLVVRDLSASLPHLSEDWLDAYFTEASLRNESQQAQLKLSDQLIEEIQMADEIVITTPMYNFTIPASLKAWFDLICRAGVTFVYTENGPQGLLKGKKVNIIISTGGVTVQSSIDFATDYLRHVLSFIGLDDVNIIAADKMNVDAEASRQKAEAQIGNLFLNHQAA